MDAHEFRVNAQVGALKETMAGSFRAIGKLKDCIAALRPRLKFPVTRLYPHKFIGPLRPNEAASSEIARQISHLERLIRTEESNIEVSTHMAKELMREVSNRKIEMIVTNMVDGLKASVNRERAEAVRREAERRAAAVEQARPEQRATATQHAQLLAGVARLENVAKRQRDE